MLTIAKLKAAVFSNIVFNLGRAETGLSLWMFEFCVGMLKEKINLKDKSVQSDFELFRPKQQMVRLLQIRHNKKNY